MTSQPERVPRQRLQLEDVQRPIVLAAVAIHVLFLIAPLDVLAPVDPHALGRRLLDGELPYQDFQFEYPPLAVVPFLLSGLVPSSLALSALAAQAIVLEVLVLVVVLRRHQGAVLRFSLLSILTFPFLSGGFDAYVMAAIVISTELLSRADPRGWWVAAVGVPIKLASAVAWVWARARLRVGVVAGMLAATLALLPIALVGLHRDSWIGYSLDRGTQAESVGASTTWAWRTLSGGDIKFEYRFRAWELAGAESAAMFWAGLGICVLLGVSIVAFRYRLDPWLAAYAATLVLLASNKVLSPQFIAWGMPLAAVLGGRWFVAHLATATLTLAIFLGSSDLDVASVTILARNALLVGTAAVALCSVVLAARRRGRVTARR